MTVETSLFPSLIAAVVFNGTDGPPLIRIGSTLAALITGFALAWWETRGRRGRDRGRGS